VKWGSKITPQRVLRARSIGPLPQSWNSSMMRATGLHQDCVNFFTISSVT